MLRQDFEQQTKKLIGHSITHVDYLEIDYTDKSGNPVKKPNWNRDKQFDSLDYGLDLITESGDVFWISWGCEFTCYGISIILNPIDNHKKNMRIWDVSYNSGWRSFIGQKIQILIRSNTHRLWKLPLWQTATFIYLFLNSCQMVTGWVG